MQGLNGLYAAQGIQGTTGIQGNTGTQGLQGVQGTIGLQGLQGLNGLYAAQGIQGLQGAQGPEVVFDKYLQLDTQVPFTVERYVGTLDVNGEVNISFTNANKYVLSVDAYYKNISGSAVTLEMYEMSATQVTLTGGVSAANRKYRICIIYTNNLDTNW